MTNKEKIQFTKDKLLNATIKLMEEMDDPLTVTSREIARKAECNPAMINYCFGSREKLIYSVFECLYMGHLKEKEVTDLQHENLSPKDFLKRVYYEVTKFFMENYNFAQALGSFILFKRDLSQESFTYPYIVEHYKGTKSEEECKLIAYEISAMMQLIICRKDEIKENFGFDIENDSDLQKIVDLRIDLLLKDLDSKIESNT